ncbi:MAG: pyridoxamine 5'-phosphate oxidase family protein [Actinomycetota bacterium]
MPSSLDAVAPSFVDMAHRIVWCTVATVEASGRPRTRVLHPIWEFDGDRLTGWIATAPQSLKATHLEHQPAISLTYWDASQDTCTADCNTTWELDEEAKRAGWDRFANGPEPVGYDPRLIPAWTAPTVDAFGVLRLDPVRLRVMPGSVLLRGEGEVLTWSEGAG